jgi:large subunit ribosomal protein L17
MRHGHGFRKLNRSSSHRRALLRNMATSLVLEGRITTTLPKAKELKKVADKLITLGKTDTLHARRLALGYLMAIDREATGNVHKKSAMHKLFTELAPQFAERNGGYTRVIRLSEYRDGDKAEMAVIEFVEAGAPTKKEKKGRRERKVRKPVVEAAVAQEAVADSQ